MSKHCSPAARSARRPPSGPPPTARPAPPPAPASTSQGEVGEEFSPLASALQHVERKAAELIEADLLEGDLLKGVPFAQRYARCLEHWRALNGVDPAVLTYLHYGVKLPWKKGRGLTTRKAIAKFQSSRRCPAPSITPSHKDYKPIYTQVHRGTHLMTLRSICRVRPTGPHD